MLKNAKQKGVPFTLASAKTPKNFNDFLELLVRKYLKKIEGRLESTIIDGLKLEEQNEREKKPRKKGAVVNFILLIIIFILFL